MISKIIFLILSVICGLSAFIPYLFDTFKLKTKPHIYTWIIWAMTQGTATFAIFYGGGRLGGVELAIGVVLQIVVIIFSLKYGTKDITKSDKIILLIAFLSIIIWWQLKQPILSVILISAIDIFGYMPTFRKSYKDPWSETLTTWILFALSNIFAILALSEYNFLTVTYLASITVANLSFFIFCISRRYFSKKVSKNVAIKIAKDFLKTELEKEEWFIKIKPSVRAYVLYGSVAKKTNRPDSDIDIMIILPLEQEEKHTKGEYFYDYNGLKINIVLRSIEKLIKIASEKKDLFQKEIFRKSEVLMDTDGEVGDLLKEIEKI